jgi:hypothetical protein
MNSLLSILTDTERRRKSGIIALLADPLPSPGVMGASAIRQVCGPESRLTQVRPGSTLLVTRGNGIVLSLQGLGFWTGVLGFLVAAGLVILAMGRFAVAGTFLGPQLGHEITFRFIGAAIGFVVISSAAF